MKKIWLVCLTCVLMLALVACGAKEIEVGTFSYAEDCAYWGKDNHHAFVNTTPQEVNTAEQAIELAKNEVKIRYNAIDVAYDEQAEMWRVDFYQESRVQLIFGGDQLVYLDKNGITKKIVLGK
ncbi:MAG: hypothetical protein IJO42_03235 [Clostridia bacterium]|nr:hypothetical protein [Clostridia bacterium]